MPFIKKILLFTAIPFFFLSLFANISTRMGYNIQEEFPFIMGIHLAAIFLFIPSLLLSILDPENRGKTRKEAGENLFKGKPFWIKIPLFLLLPYAMFNFFTSPVGSTLEKDGKIYEHSHGTIIREITPEQKREFERGTVSMFSGHWMVFLFAVILLNYPKKEEEVEGKATKPSQNEFEKF